MKSQKQALINAILFSFMILLTILSSQVRADEKQWVFFRDNIPQEVERFNIILEFTHSSSRFYDASRHGIKSEEIKGGRKKDKYKQQLNLGMAIDGNRYMVMIKDASDIKIISQNSDRLCMAKVLRIKDRKKSETVKEGFLFFHRDVEIPLEVFPEQIAVPFKEPVTGVLKINIYSNNYPVYEARYSATLNGTLSGSTSTKKAFLNASITCRSSLELKDRHLKLSLKPFDDQMSSASCSGKISDTLMLGSAKLVVEKIASDSSELVLALLDGDFIQERKQDETLATVGKPFPDFARVELAKRQLLTLDDMKKQVGIDGYIVLVFGDFKRAMPEHCGRRDVIKSLTLDKAMIIEILKKDCDKTMVVGFVCRQLSLSDLYEKWLGRDPEFHVISDFSNPLDMQFVDIGMEPHMYRRSDKGETLRGKMKFTNEKVITALIDGNGDLVYLNTDAGKELAGSLVQISNLMKEGKKAEKQD